MLILLERNCSECVSEFDDMGGCECILNQPCDVSALIPDGCNHCGSEAAKHCTPDVAGGYKHILIKYTTNLQKMKFHVFHSLNAVIVKSSATIRLQ